MSSDESNSTFYKKKHNISESNVDSIIDLEVWTHQSTASSSSTFFSSFFDNFVQICEVQNTQGSLGIRNILRRCVESPVRLYMIKEKALLYGHDIIFRELLNSRPEVTGKMILEVCRLLEISPLEINNQLEYIKLILERGFKKTMDVCSVDGISSLDHLIMIKKEAFLYGHDIIFHELLNSRPEVTGKMILEVCRLLEISPQEIDNQLEYIKLILGQEFRETVDVRSVDGALADLNMIKKKALLYGHDIIFRKLHNSWPEVTNKMILEVCRLLEISPLEIDNQLGYIKLILGRGFRKTMDVCSVDGPFAHLNMIKKEVHGHDIIFRELLNSRPEVNGALAHLKMIKKEALLYGHDIIFCQLLNSRPEVTGKMILEVCRLLEISPLEIDNQLEYIKLILGRGLRKTMDVRSVDGISSLAHLNMIKKEALLYGHDIIFRELLNSQPEVTGKMILEVCRLLELSLLNFDNKLKYIKLILGRGFRKHMDVCFVDGISSFDQKIMIIKEASLYGHDIIFRELLNSRPEVTGKMILEVFRLLKISPLEIDTQLEYIKLILRSAQSRFVVYRANSRFSETIYHSYVRSVDDALTHLNIIKEGVLLYGHDNTFRELLNSRPKVTGTMILDVCRLLEISPLEIDNQLEYVKLILGRGFRDTIDVRSVDGALVDLNVIKNQAILYGHDIIFRELLNSRPKVTGKMILKVCRLLEILPLEIDNQLEYIKLILGRGFREIIDVRSVDGVLADLNMIKNEALLYGHDIIFRELLNSRPEVTGKMILEVCRLLEISPLEIDNQLEYVKLILGRGFRDTIDVRSVDGALVDLNVIKNQAILYGHDIIFRELLNSRPKVTGKMILKICRLLEILPLEIDNQLEYIKLILGRGFREIIDVRSVDGVLADLNMIKNEALLYGHDIIFRELLNSRPKVTGKMILEVCRVLEISPLEIDNQLEYIKLTLGQGFRETMDVRSVDDIGNTALHYALERNWYKAATVLLKEGSYLGQMNKFNNIVIADIPEFTLSSYFNDCIQLKNEWTDECMIEFDYRCLMPHENFTEQQEILRATCEMEVILYIANNDILKHLLRHPLISSFLYIKWYMIRHVLYANFVFYTMFYFFVNAYILSMTYDTSSRNKQQIANDSFNTVFASTFFTLQNNVSWVFVMGMLLLFTYREILQFRSYPQRYFVDLENWSQVLLIVLTFALLCGAGLQIKVMVILLSTWELMTLISYHLFPSCIEMFRTVFFNFVRFFFSYLILILAFTLAFYMLLRNDGFSNPGLSLFKTIIMFTGEFDANDISFSAYPVWSRIVFVLFIFYIVIVLFNLLNGLAINNIAEILNKAKIIGLISRVRLIACFERMIVAKPFCWKKWTWSNPFNFFSKKVLLFPHYLKFGKISFKPYNDNLIVYDGDRHNVDGYSMDWSTLKMDPNIVKHAKQVVYDKNELSNDDIMNELAKLQTRLTQIKNTLRCKDDDEENIIVN
ncbi:uncharacterized protein LOC143907709 isoform X2 [Temnothorax americanus]|uniref:uncharacterized protein LOC143907709 isoform X2 n=1 Tax=Temnothorax americanus TaxID=1964332 RepID=UPI004067DF75